MAVTKSLTCLELPKATVKSDELTGSKKWHVDKTEKLKALKLKETPISTTYGEFGGILLIDPTLKETQLGRYDKAIIVPKSQKFQLTNYSSMRCK